MATIEPIPIDTSPIPHHGHHDFVRLFIWSDSFNMIEKLSREAGGWPTNSKYDCPNGLRSTVGYHFPNGVPEAFKEAAVGLGAKVMSG